MPYRVIPATNRGLGYDLSGLPPGSNPGASTSTDRFYHDDNVYPTRQFPLVYEKQYTNVPVQSSGYHHFGSVTTGDELVGGVMFFVTASAYGQARFVSGYSRFNTGSYVSQQNNDCSGDTNGATLQGTGTVGTLGRNEIWNTTDTGDFLLMVVDSIGGGIFNGFYDACTQSSYLPSTTIGAPYSSGSDYFNDAEATDDTWSLAFDVIRYYSTIYLHFSAGGGGTTTTTTAAPTTTTTTYACQNFSSSGGSSTEAAACADTIDWNYAFNGVGSWPQVGEACFLTVPFCQVNNTAKVLSDNWYQLGNGDVIQITGGLGVVAVVNACTT